MADEYTENLLWDGGDDGPSLAPFSPHPRAESLREVGAFAQSPGPFGSPTAGPVFYHSYVNSASHDDAAFSYQATDPLQLSNEHDHHTYTYSDSAAPATPTLQDEPAADYYDPSTQAYYNQLSSAGYDAPPDAAIYNNFYLPPDNWGAPTGTHNATTYGNIAPSRPGTFSQESYQAVTLDRAPSLTTTYGSGGLDSQLYDAESRTTTFSSVSSLPSPGLPRYLDESSTITINSPSTVLSSRHYPCQRGCEQTFTSDKDRDRHYRSAQHYSEDLGKYQCRCGTAQSRKDNHTRHLNTCDKHHSTCSPYVCACLNVSVALDIHRSHVVGCRSKKRGPRKGSKKPRADPTSDNEDGL